MNYLAHVFLTSPYPLLTVGNLIGDMIRNSQVKSLHPKLIDGILIHRFIDSYTDKHPNVLNISHLFTKSQGKYAPVVSDIILDFVLAKHWNKYSTESFDQWCYQAYDMIDNHYSLMPPLIKKRIASMINGKWLHSYATEDGISYAFSRLAKRAKFDNSFELAFDHYMSNADQIDEEFHLFFPDMIAETKKLITAKAQPVE